VNASSFEKFTFAKQHNNNLIGGSYTIFANESSFGDTTLGIDSQLYIWVIDRV